MEAAAQHLLDFSKPFDTELLDQIVKISNESSHAQRSAACEFLINLKDNPNMWRRVDAILETSQHLPSKFFALLVLRETINTRWKIIPTDQREGIRNYIVSKIIALSENDDSLSSHHSYLSQLNLVLVQILKQDWPSHWPTFIGDIVGSSKVSESLCENNMIILRLLSEEIFDYSFETMTTAKVKTMKETLNSEFAQVFELCLLVLDNCQKRSLLNCTLLTLQKFLTWIPVQYIFESKLLPTLLTKYFPTPLFRTITLDCLIEIASLPLADIPQVYWITVQQILAEFVNQLGQIILPHVDVALAYENGAEEDKIFILRLGLFLSSFLKSFLSLFDQPDGSIAYEAVVLQALSYLIRVSQVHDDDVFKTCLEFWHHFAKELYTLDAQIKSTPGSLSFNPLGGYSAYANSRTKHGIYEKILSDLRLVMIEHMAKPEEVIIVEIDGVIVRERTKDTEVIAQYKTMREAIVYLTHLNFLDTEDQMLRKLDYEIHNGKLPWNGLNTLCWAIGSISGAMSEKDEKSFLVAVIKDLLKLCEEQKGKDNKAVVASNIMYIVGQYPRFLRMHWKFLKTVVNKLFEFMHESHPGVQDMACDTFLKIAQKCKRKFMTKQKEDNEPPKQPFILTLIADLNKHIYDLQPLQALSFYESVGTMLSDNGQGIDVRREEVILQLMELSNSVWRRIIYDGAQCVETLFDKDRIKEIGKIVKINIHVCRSAGSIYAYQLVTIFNDLMLVYRLYSEQITTACHSHANSKVILGHDLYKSMKTAKSEILELMTCLIDVCRDIEGGPQNALSTFLPQLIVEILKDYRTSPSVARDSKVLTLFATTISVLKHHINNDIPVIMDAIFEPTLEMITTNMVDHPEHRIGFFSFLREANSHCFYGLFSIPPHHQKLVIDSIVWAFKHIERNISEVGLEILEELLKNVANAQIAQSFYQSFLVSLVQDVLSVMTDRSHKSGFKVQCSVLKHLFQVVQSGHVLVPLYDPNTTPGIFDNSQYLREHVVSILVSAYANVTRAQVHAFVTCLFDVSLDVNAFKQHVRDFLIEIKEFASEDNSDLFIEETEANLELLRKEQYMYRQSVPGLLKPDEIDEEDFDN